MKSLMNSVSLAGLGFLLTVILAGCNESPPASLYDPTFVSQPAPVVESVTSSPGALAGVSVVRIVGRNFSSRVEDNVVMFDATPASILQASPTELRVKAPLLIKDSIMIRVGVIGSDKYSTPALFRLDAAVYRFGKLASDEDPYGIASDAAGNIYVSLLKASLGIGVKKFAPDGSRSDFSPPFSSAVNKWTGMKVGPGGAFFAVTLRSIIFRIPATGGAAAVWLSGGGLGPLSDLDFDSQGNIWAGGENNPSIYRVRTSDKNVKAFPFRGTVRSIRVFENAVFVGGKRDSLEKVWRFPIISADSLGPETEYFDLSALYGPGGKGVYSVTFAKDGDMYIGTDAPDAILVVHPNKVSEPLYPGLLSPLSLGFAWGAGTDLYVVRGGLTATHDLFKVETLKPGAPYYGRLLP